MSAPAPRPSRWLPLAVVALGSAACDPSAEVEGLVALVRTDDQRAPTVGTATSGDPPSGSAPAPTVEGPSVLLAGGQGRFVLGSDAAIREALLSVAGQDGYFALPLPGETRATVVVRLADAAEAGTYRLRFQTSDGTRTTQPAPATLTVVPPSSAGELQVELTWDTAADLDLHVVEPLGILLDANGEPVREEIYFANPAALSGGLLELDANASCLPDAQPLERITWIAPLEGTYDVYVDPWAGCDVSTPTEYTLVARVRGVETARATGTVAPGTETRGSACVPDDDGTRGCLRALPDLVYTLP